MPTILSQYPLFQEKSMRERDIEGGRRGSRPGPEAVSAVESSTAVITHQQKYRAKHEDSFPWSMKPVKKHSHFFFSISWTIHEHNHVYYQYRSRSGLHHKRGQLCPPKPLQLSSLFEMNQFVCSCKYYCNRPPWRCNLQH
jgi:hypothetical protein